MELSQYLEWAEWAEWAVNLLTTGMILDESPI